LVATHKKYDPNDVFTKLQPVWSTIQTIWYCAIWGGRDIIIIWGCSYRIVAI
jgi:hypothetical protein